VANGHTAAPLVHLQPLLLKLLPPLLLHLLHPQRRRRLPRRPDEPPDSCSLPPLSNARLCRTLGSAWTCPPR
jgi:hypothetical protein